MAEESQTQTQTQTQGSQVDWSQGTILPTIPLIWGRLYRTPNKHCWREDTTDLNHIEYLDLISEEFTLGRALTCDFVMKKDIITDQIKKNVSKLHFLLRRDTSIAQSPAVLVDCSYNGTFVNGQKVGKGQSRVLDNNDEISITHPVIKIFIFKDHLKNEQESVPQEISEKYYISRTLGQGACGVVKLVYNKLTCERHAMKIIKKNRFSTSVHNNLNNPNKINNEINILRHIRHPFIISTEEIFESRDAVYIVLELAEGGELFECITRRGRLSERHTRLLFRQMVIAVMYLHQQGITHRDLKPENVLLESGGEDATVKISDFGLSKLMDEGSFMRTVCGTPLYLAPEVLQASDAGYTPQVDVWSLGVIFFICLSGYLPFSSEYRDMALREQILAGRYTFSEAHWRGVSGPARRLMRRMLTVDARKRISLHEILCDPWMQDAEVISRVEALLCRGAPAPAPRPAPAPASAKRALSSDTARHPEQKKMRLDSNANEEDKENTNTERDEDTGSGRSSDIRCSAGSLLTVQ